MSPFVGLLMLNLVVEEQDTDSESMISQYWQVFLAQGVCVGVGSGFLYVPSLGALSSAFSTKRAAAIGIATSASSLGKVITSRQILWPKLTFILRWRDLSGRLSTPAASNWVRMGCTCRRICMFGNNYSLLCCYAGCKEANSSSETSFHNRPTRIHKASLGDLRTCSFLPLCWFLGTILSTYLRKPRCLYKFRTTCLFICSLSLTQQPYLDESCQPFWPNGSVRLGFSRFPR